MIKKCLMCMVGLAFLVIASGCNTLKGATEGAAQGAKKDWEETKKVDDWFRKNLW